MKHDIGQCRCGSTMFCASDPLTQGEPVTLKALPLGHEYVRADDSGRCGYYRDGAPGKWWGYCGQVEAAHRAEKEGGERRRAR